MIDHVAYSVPQDVLDSPDMTEFWQTLGFHEFTADDRYRDRFMGGYWARWFTNGSDCDVHMVAGPGREDWGLEHLCLKDVGEHIYGTAVLSRFCTRNSGSGRIWLTGPGGIRVEVHK